jgi:single-stranded-DNA-specific exonuclease
MLHFSLPVLPDANTQSTFVTQHRWQVIPTDEAAIQRLQAELGLEPLFCRLLIQRGIDSREKARLFFKPTFADLHDPFLMQDMDRAVQRLDEAILRQEKILLYGDYDVDGTTSVAMMYSFLSVFYQHIDYYLPDREKEGYGVSLASVEYAREQGCKLVIAMDCGIKAHDAIALASSYGIDYIVCDHHVPEGGLPAAVANLDPKRSDCPYPYKELSGCGIAFKLAQAFSRYHHMPSEALEPLLDLVAVSIACDIVPVTGENRILAYIGLQQLNRSPRVGLWALMDQINRPKPLNITDIVFGLGPIINSAGRLGDARDAVRQLLAADRQSAILMASGLVRRNRERQDVDYAMADQAKKRFLDKPGWEQTKSIVLFDADWHKGVIGIAASRMAEAYNRPTVILTRSNGRAVGSARSVRGFDLYEALQQCEDLFYSFGGHAFAAGMQMPEENIPLFAQRFEQLVQNSLSEAAQAPLIEIAAQIQLEDITPGFWKMLRRFEPFGPHNRSPVFQVRDLRDAGKTRLLENNHVRFAVRPTNGKTTIGGIGFGLGTAIEVLKNQRFDLLFTLREEHWRGDTSIGMVVKDARPHQPTESDV